MLSEEYPEWKALLTEVLAAVAKRLTSIADYSSFRGVCSSWRCAATFDNFDREFPRAPCLLYFVKETEEEGEGEEEETSVDEKIVTKFLDLESNTSKEEEEEGETPVDEKIVTKLLDLESNTSKIVKFPPQSPYRYLSCSGWILVSNETETSLKHFMLGISIKLPLSDAFISKMVLSGSPMESGLVVMVIWGHDDRLAFCSPGDECWTLTDRCGVPFADIIYHDRKLYGLDYRLNIVEYDIHGSNPTKILGFFYSRPDDEDLKFGCGVQERFLVESFGKFLLVLQMESRNESSHFRIFEIELKDGSCSYEEIDNIGDRCLFLGLNSSICVSSTSLQLKPNCIYFSKKNPYRRSEKLQVGVFYRSGDRVGYFEDFSCRFDFCFPTPVWVVPSI